MFDTKADKASRKLALSKKQEKENKKKRIITIVVLSAFVLISAIAITVNSNFIRRTVPVITIDGVGFSAAEFEFFFNNELSDYMQFISQFQGMGLPEPDPTRPLTNQINPNTGESWAAFFTESALASMVEITTLYNLAKNEGFTLSQEHQDEIDEELMMIEMQAMFSQFPSADSLLQRMFGSAMNERIYRSLMEMTYTVRYFSEYKRSSLEFSDDQVIAYYNEHRDDLDVFNYREFLVTVELPAEGLPDDEDELENVIDQITQDAHQRASLFADEIHSEEDFIEVAGNYNEIFSSPDATFRRLQGARIDASLSEWLLDASRTHGDTTIIDSDHGSSVIFFVSRDDNNYRTVAMRQLLLLRQSVDPDEFAAGLDDPEYIEALENAENELEARAQEVYALFNAAGRTEEALIELIEEYSDEDTGGYYSDIAKLTFQGFDFHTMRVVPELENWLFETGRATGDSELIYTADFGYHLTIFMGEGDVFFEMIALDRLRTEHHNEWLDGLERAEPVRHASFILVHR
jgi:hypothetical protein